MTGPVFWTSDRPLLTAVGTAAVVALGVRPGSASGPESGPEPVVPVDRWPLDVVAYLRRAEATGRAGEVTEIPLVAQGRTRSVLLVGVGDEGLGDLRAAAAAAARRSVGQPRLAVDLGQRTSTQFQAVAEGAGLAAYGYTLASTAGPRPVRRVDLHLPEATEDTTEDTAEDTTADTAADTAEDTAEDTAADTAAVEAAIARAAAVVTAVHRARDLTNTPSNRKSPQWLAEQARRVGEAAGLRVRVLDTAALARGGFGGLLAVGGGSTRPPIVVQLEYRPASSTSPGRRPRHIGLVGKGITFDSGGLSLKPAEAMTTMKTDMAGAAAVLAVMAALPEVSSPVRVSAVLAIAENLPSGSAVRPGDVLTTYDGTTVEVLNTDAEGRLVLADALGLATTGASVPDAVVDLATLTGAASVGLGRRDAALFADDDDLAAELLAAGRVSGERVWRMPLVDEYRFALESPVADLAHVARDRTVSGGSITAALFLQAFTHGVPWAHLDIAGPARAEADAAEISKGGTGFGVRLLLEWLGARDDSRRLTTTHDD